MKHGALLAAMMLAASCGAASAQQQPPVTPPDEAAPPPPAAEGMTPAPQDGDAPSMSGGMEPEGRGDDMRGGHHMGHPHMGMHMGRAGQRRGATKGFEIRMGGGAGLRVNCGDEPIQACVDAAAPLIDRLSGATPPPGGQGGPSADP